MNSTKSFGELVGALYDCVINPSLWQQTMNTLTECFGGIIGTLAIMDVQNNRARFGAAGGDPAVYTPLITTYAADMPLYGIMPKLEIDDPISMDTLYSHFGPEGRKVMYDSRLGREWAIPNRVADGLLLAVMKDSHRVGLFSITTTEDRRDITSDDLSFLAQLAPHIRRAATINDLLEESRTSADTLQQVLDAIQCAVFIVTENMRLLHANAEAEDMLKARAIVANMSGKLSFPAQRSADAIAFAVTQGIRDEVALSSFGIGVPVTQNYSDAVAHVLPLKRREYAQSPNSEAAAAIFVSVRGGAVRPAIEAIAALYGFTPAEKRVAALAVSGLSRQEIAMKSGVSDNTVRTQLDAIYSKAGLRSQRELLLVAQELTPPIK